jgi:putative nucleotidyltransferase with HDIG domain/diguanylate cyclase (GGDEF)-like protein
MVLLKELKQLGQDISVLYVEDDVELLKGVASYLGLVFPSVDTAKNGEEGLEKYSKSSYDIVITDIQMPKMNGIKMIQEIKKININQEILITTAFSEVHYLLKAIEAEVSGYIVKPINFDNINRTLYRVVQRINILKENIRYKTQLEKMVEEKTTQNFALQIEKIDNYEQTLLSLIELVEKRDTYTGGHSQRVAKYSKMIAEHMSFSKQECEFIYKAGILHDIGKIETPDAVLLNPGKLDNFQFDMIKRHVLTGANMLKKIPMYKDLSKIIAQHHERYDGRGYPNKLKGDEILPLARIMIAADAFDAMTTNRIYKPRMSKANALQELKTFSRTQFDPEVAKHAINVFEKMKLVEDIFQLPSTCMEEKKFAFFFEDQLTGARNKTYLELVIVQNKDSDKTQYINLLLLHNFSEYNKRYGWSSGNLLLQQIVKILQEKYDSCCVFRLEGDDFVILTEEDIDINSTKIVELLKKSGDILHIETKKFNTEDWHIESIDDFNKLL